MLGKHYNMKKLICFIVFLIAFAVFLFALLRLFSMMKEYQTGRNEYDTIKDFAGIMDFDENDLTEFAGESVGNHELVDFDELIAINEDCIGWIQFENTDISYPIAQGQDNEFYLTHHFNKKINSAGSIFMDYVNEKDFSDPFTILYGHNMKDGSMFAKLNQYESRDFYVGNPVFWIYTPENIYCYQIFSCYSMDLKTETQFETDLDVILERSQYNTGILPQRDDKILTLMTCNSDGDTSRFFVHAMQVNDERVEKVNE